MGFICFACTLHAVRRWLVSGTVVLGLFIALVGRTTTAGTVFVDNSFDFSRGPLGWTPTPVGLLGFLPPADPAKGARWTHANETWSVDWAPVYGPLVATGNHLVSPPIPVSEQSDSVNRGRLFDTLRISIAHRFDFGPAATVPAAAGQVAYSINGGPFVGIPTSAWESDTLAALVPADPFGSSPLWPNHVDQQALVIPAFLPPSGGYADLFPLVNGGATFIGSTPGYSSGFGKMVPSVAVITFPEQEIDSLRLRFTNANLGSACSVGVGWDLGYVQVDFAAPEPKCFTVAVAGAAATLGMTSRRRTCLRRSANDQ